MKIRIALCVFFTLLLLAGCSGVVKYSITAGEKPIYVSCYMQGDFLHIKVEGGRHIAINVNYITDYRIEKTVCGLYCLHITAKTMTFGVYGDLDSLIKVKKMIVRHKHR